MKLVKAILAIVFTVVLLIPFLARAQKSSYSTEMNFKTVQLVLVNELGFSYDGLDNNRHPYYSNKTIDVTMNNDGNYLIDGDISGYIDHTPTGYVWDNPTIISKSLVLILTSLQVTVLSNQNWYPSPMTDNRHVHYNSKKIAKETMKRILELASPEFTYQGSNISNLENDKIDMSEMDISIEATYGYSESGSVLISINCIINPLSSQHIENIKPTTRNIPKFDIVRLCKQEASTRGYLDYTMEQYCLQNEKASLNEIRANLSNIPSDILNLCIDEADGSYMMLAA